MAEAVEGVTSVEVVVIEEADGTCGLWELPAAWSENGTEEDRRAAVPLLREAVVNLGRRAFVDVHVLVRGPRGAGTPEAVPPHQVEAAVADMERWFGPDESTGLVTLTLTDAGAWFL